MEGEEIHRREVTCISDQIASHREVKLEPKFVTNKIIAVSTVKPVKESFQSQVEIIENVESEKLSLNNKDCFVKHTPRKGEKENAPYNGANGRPEGSLERIFVEKTQTLHPYHGQRGEQSRPKDSTDVPILDRPSHAGPTIRPDITPNSENVAHRPWSG